MRILFVNEKCGYFGGVEQNVAVTVRGLNSLGHECFLAYGSTKARNFEDYKSIFRNVFLCSEISDDVESTFSQSFDEIVRAVSPGVIYLHKVQKTDFCIPFINKIRIVRMIHDHDLCCPRKHKYFFHNTKVCHVRAGWRCYFDMAFVERGAGFLNRFKFVSISNKLREMRQNYNWDSLLVGSRFMMKELIQNGFPESRIHIVAPSVPIKPVQITAPSLDPRILCVSQLIRGKGVDLLLLALKNLSCNFKATIVGTGNAELELKQLSHSLELDGKVDFTGWVDNDSIGSFYTNARVVAVPCRWPEPFGMIGLEAMRHARPVVAFDVGGIPDWLENEVTGLLVAEQDVSGLAKALERILLDHDLAKQLGESSVIRARDRFSFEEYLHKIVKYLKLN